MFCGSMHTPLLFLNMSSVNSLNFSCVAALLNGMDRKCVKGSLCLTDDTMTSILVLAETIPALCSPRITIKAGRQERIIQTICPRSLGQCNFR